MLRAMAKAAKSKTTKPRGPGREKNPEGTARPQIAFPDPDGRVADALEKWQAAEREAGRLISRSEIARRAILRAWKERGERGEEP